MGCSRLGASRRVRDVRGHDCEFAAEISFVDAVVLAGLHVAYAFCWEALVLVWCYFPAAASITILGHFEWVRRGRLRTAAHG